MKTRFPKAETRVQNAKCLSRIFFVGALMDSAQKKPGLTVFLMNLIRLQDVPKLRLVLDMIKITVIFDCFFVCINQGTCERNSLFIFYNASASRVHIFMAC